MSYTLKQSDLDKVKNIQGRDAYGGFFNYRAGETIEDGDRLTFNAKDGEKFTDRGVYFYAQDPNTGGMQYFYADFSNENKRASIVYSGGYGLSIETESAGPPPPDAEVTAEMMLTLSEANASLYVDGELASEGTGLYYGSNLRFVAADGYEFFAQDIAYNVKTSVYFSGQDAYGQIVYMGFEFGETNAEVLGEYEDLNSNYPPTLHVETVQVTSDVGNNSSYIVTKNQISEINKARFVTQTNTDGPQVYDYGQFILGLVEVPFSLPEDFILEDEEIYLASKGTGVSAPKIQAGVFDYDMGEISVPATNGNLLDFSNVIIKLNLPFTDAVNIDVSYVVGETLSIIYRVNFYEGTAKILISSSKIGDVFLTIETTLGIDVPYSAEFGTIQTLANSNMKLGGDNGIRIPFAEVVRQKAVLPYGVFTIPILDEGELSNFNGFVSVENIDLKTSANMAETNAIVSMLNNGVFINE